MSDRPTHALVFAAGKGERMRPLTDTTPKPLLVAGGKPLIVWHLEKLAALGVREVVINTSWLADRFAPVLGDGEAWGLRLHYVYEGPEPLETGGGMLNALPLLGHAPFLAIAADVWTDVDFAALHREPAGLAHLVMVANPDHHGRGDFALGHDGRLRLATAGAEALTFSGIGLYRREFLDGWRSIVGPAPGADDAPPRFKLRPLFDDAIPHGTLTGQYHDGRWTDVGTPERLAALDAQLPPPVSVPMHDNAPQPSERSPATISPDAASAAGHFAVWQLIAAASSLLAAVSAFNEDGRSALFFGSNALTATALAFVCRQLRGSGRSWAHDRLLWFTGASVWMLAMAVAAGACLHFEVGLEILGVARIGRERLQMLATVIGMGFAALALMTMAFGERGRRTPWLRKRTSVAWLLAVLLLGPEIRIRDDAGRWTLARQTLPEAVAQPWARHVTLQRVATGQVDENGAHVTVLCPAWQSDRWLLLRLERDLVPDTYDESVLATWRASCADQAEEALANGEAAESALLRGDVSTFLSNADGLRSTDVIALPLDRFEPSLRQRLSDRIPPYRQAETTLFDLILVEGTDEQVRQSLPREENIHPHHRYALYARGLADLAAHMPRMTAESYANEQMQSASVYAQLGIVNPMMLATIAGSPDVPYTGGYTDHDFYVANRHCDADYAAFLAEKGLRPTIEHARQLLDALILVRFESHSAQTIDPFIPTTLGLPAGKTIEQCPSLARWYGTMIPPRDAPDIARIMTAVDEARRAAIHWRNLGLPTAAEPPTLAADAAVEILMQTPPSAAAYCSWVNAAFWELVDPQEQVPETTPALLRLQEHWSDQPWEDIAVTRFDERKAKAVPDSCPLQQSEYGGNVPSTLATLDRSLEALGIPCRVGPKDDRGIPSLVCRSR